MEAHIVFLLTALFSPFLFWFGGAGCLRKAKRYRRLLVSRELLLRDKRPPVIYLRHFSDDSKLAEQTHSRGSTAISAILSFMMKTEEEQLVEVLNEIGPVIALGRPKQLLPELGALRIYVGDEWQSVVRELVSNAKLVVFRCGISENLLIEVGIVRYLIQPEQLLFAVPRGKAKYQEFRQLVEKQHDICLPNYTLRTQIGSLVGFIRFQTWETAQFLPFKNTMRGSFFSPYAGSYKIAIRPVYDKLQIPWVSPNVSPLVVIELGIILVFLLALLLNLSE